MPNIATIADVAQQVAAGKCQLLPLVDLAAGPGTAATAASGYFGLTIGTNTIGTTYPGTLQGFQGVPGMATDYRSILNYINANRGGFLARLYTIGTLNLAATGNQFTHDAATFPVLRTKYGQANQPVNLVPLIYVTTATSTTAPAFILKASDGTAGYKNQSGARVVGTKTFTFPASTTTAQSAYILRLEDGDDAVQDVVQVDVTTASSAGAATIYGMEKLAPYCGLNTLLGVVDSLVGRLGMENFRPAVATSGTATSILAYVNYGTGTVTMFGYSVAARALK